MTQAEIDEINKLINRVEVLPKVILPDEILATLSSGSSTERASLFNVTLQKHYTEINDIKKDGDENGY